MEAVKNGSPVGYPLSTPCQLCRKRAWRLFGMPNRRFDSAIGYRCSLGHITLRGTWEFEHVRPRETPLTGIRRRVSGNRPVALVPSSRKAITLEVDHVSKSPRAVGWFQRVGRGVSPI